MKYEIKTIGRNGKFEVVTIDADSISVLDGLKSSLVLFKRRTKLVLVIPQALLLSAQLTTQKETQLKVVAMETANIVKFGRKQERG